MITLLVSDVHERYDTLLRIEKTYFSKVDRIVFLGDWFDTFGKRRPALIVEWLKRHLYLSNFETCWGNHDFHYAFSFGHCSGYDFHTQACLDEMMSKKDWRQLKPWTTVGPYLVSHAGFVTETLHLKDQAEEAIELAFNGQRHPYWDCGMVRGGSTELGGPVWLDWNMEFEPIPGIKQIVGHTVISKGAPQEKSGSWNLDTCNRHVMLVDETTGKIDIKEI